MRMTELIHKKQADEALKENEIQWMISEYTEGNIPDYQMSAMLMAVYFNGMEDEELTHLTEAMAASGDQIDFSSIDGLTVDKHSTGGVGDTTSLILVPLVASVGAYVPKMSGRGLGHTGGTIDKLESIPGYQVELSEEKFIQQVNDIHCAMVGQTGNLAPADKKLYALRDVTSTVEAIPLIASSIMSKKLASGAEGIVLDVKVGEGAFMKSVREANQLAQTMINIGRNAGRKVTAIISDMSQPLGYAVGNILEVKEAIATLKGEGPEDLTELSLVLASHMVFLAGIGEDIQQSRDLVEEQISNGQALEKFKEMVERQGGDVSYIDHPEKFDLACRRIQVEAAKDGKISEINALEIGRLAEILGAGRETLEDEIDLTAGLVLNKKVGDSVQEGELIATLHTNKSDEELAEVQDIIQRAVRINWIANKNRLVLKTIE